MRTRRSHRHGQRRAVPSSSDAWTGLRAVWGWAWRLGVLIVAFAVASAAAFVSGAAGMRFGGVVVSGALAAGGGGLAWWLFAGRGPRRVMTLAMAVVGLAIAAALWNVTPAMPGRLAASLHGVDLPAGTELVEAMEFGSPTCFDSCPSLIHRYDVPGTPGEVERALVDAFGSAGWSTRPAPYQQRTFVVVSPDAAIRATVSVAPVYVVEGEPDPTPTAPPGRTVVEVNVVENPCPPGERGC